MNIEEASANVNSPDPVIAIKAALVCTTGESNYSVGFRNGLRFAIAILTDKEPKYEELTEMGRGGQRCSNLTKRKSRRSLKK